MKTVLILVCCGWLVVSGCAGVNQFLCKPTTEQTEAANVGMATAQMVLASLAYYSGNPLVANISSMAIPIFEKVRQGYCVVQAEWDTAVTALEGASIARRGPNTAFQFLKSVKWEN